MAGHVHTHTHTHSGMPVDMPVHGMWEETGIPRKNMHRHGEHMSTPERQWLQLGINFFSPHQCYNATM